MTFLSSGWWGVACGCPWWAVNLRDLKALFRQQGEREKKPDLFSAKGSLMC